VECDGAAIDRLYVTGWLKRGPTGIIGTNRADSIETVQQIIEDISSRPFEPKRSRDMLVGELSQSQVVGMADWLRIDAAERRRGEQAGKPREKFTRIAEMLNEAWNAS
jgi:ferredoxin--NADP+ reductase